MSGAWTGAAVGVDGDRQWGVYEATSGERVHEKSHLPLHHHHRAPAGPRSDMDGFWILMNINRFVRDYGYRVCWR